MSRGRKVSDILSPLQSSPLQSHLGRGLHTLGLLAWILEQTGPAQVYVSTFSTSDAFLRGFHNLRKKGLIQEALLLADLKASRKTYRLYKEMASCFDRVYLGQNHSKVVLVDNGLWHVTVISSQNQTYGDRAECTVVTTNNQVFFEQMDGFLDIIENYSIEVNGVHKETDRQDLSAGEGPDSPTGDFCLIGY